MSTITTGFAPSHSVSQFLDEFPGGLAERWVLIARLDSDTVRAESPTIREAVAAFADEVQWTPAGLLVPGTEIASMIADDTLFYGFDEVVVFARKPVGLTALPTVFTTDVELSDETFGALSDYLGRHDGMAAAGDGVGLRWFRHDDSE